MTTVGVTSGASVPEELVTAVLGKLADHGFGRVEEVEAVEEHMTFALPRELRTTGAAPRTASATGTAHIPQGLAQGAEPQAARAASRGRTRSPRSGPCR